MTPRAKLVVDLLRANPGLDRETISEETGLAKNTVASIVLRLLARPIGDALRVRVRSYVRVGRGGPQRERLELHPTKRNASPPKPQTKSDYGKAYRKRKGALYYIAKNGARTTFAQGGVHGIWSGLL